MNVQIIWSCFAILAFLFFPLSDLWVHSCTKKANKTVPFSQLFKLTSVSVSNIISYPWSFISWVATCLVAILLKPLTFSVAPLIRVYCFNLLTLASFLLRQVCKLNSCFRAAFFLRNSYFLQVIMSLNQLLDILKMYFFESFLRHCLLGKVDFWKCFLATWLDPGWLFPRVLSSWSVSKPFYWYDVCSREKSYAFWWCCCSCWWGVVSVPTAKKKTKPKTNRNAKTQKKTSRLLPALSQRGLSP